MKGKILLTGFEPFGDDDLNPSWEVAKSLDRSSLGDLEIHAGLLPVEWGRTGDQIEAFIQEVDPVIVLSLGLASGRAEISVEKVAINYQGGAKDNKSNTCGPGYIIHGGPDAYFASIPTENVVEEMIKRGIPARLSLSAGAYLCNYAFYRASHYVRKMGQKTLVGFIHVPATPQMAAKKHKGIPSMNLTTEREGCLTALDVIVKSLTNCG